MQLVSELPAFQRGGRTVRTDSRCPAGQAAGQCAGHAGQAAGHLAGQVAGQCQPPTGQG